MRDILRCLGHQNHHAACYLDKVIIHKSRSDESEPRWLEPELELKDFQLGSTQLVTLPSWLEPELELKDFQLGSTLLGL